MLDISLGIPFEINFQFSPGCSARTGRIHIRARARAQKKIKIEEAGGAFLFSIFRKKLKWRTIGLPDGERPKLDQMCLAALIIQRPAAELTEARSNGARDLFSNGYVPVVVFVS